MSAGPVRLDDPTPSAPTDAVTCGHVLQTDIGTVLGQVTLNTEPAGLLVPIADVLDDPVAEGWRAAAP